MGQYQFDCGISVKLWDSTSLYVVAASLAVTFTRKNLLIGGKNKLRLLIVSAFSHAMIMVVAASPIMQIKWGSSRLFPRHP